jgi:periplasmic divalent cation tolerance protein
MPVRSPYPEVEIPDVSLFDFLFTPVQSTYRWRGEIHDRTEGRASLHTRRDLIPEIVRRAKETHPYEVPGISAWPIYDGNPEYLSWIVAETRHSER